MERYIRVGLVVLVAMFLIIGGTVLVLVSLNANILKPYIQQSVEKNSQRLLHINGDLVIDFYPRIGIRIGDLVLSEYRHSDQFASIKNVQLLLSMQSLPRMQLIADAVTLQGINARIIRYQDGRTNIDDLLKADEDTSPIVFEIAKTEIADGHLVFQDNKTDQVFVLNDLKLTAERLTAQSFDHVEIKTQLIKTGIKESARTQQKTAFAMQLSAEKVTVGENELLSGPVFLFMQSNASDRHSVATLSLAGLHKLNNRLNTGLIQFALESKQNEQRLHFVLDTSVDAQLNNQHWVLPEFKTGFDYVHREYTGKPINGDFAGKLSLNLLSEMLDVRFQGLLAGSPVEANVQMHSFSERRITFNMQVDRLDLDSFYSPQHIETKAQEADDNAGPVANVTATELPDLALFDDLNLNGAVHIGQFTANDVRLSGVQLTIQPKRQHFELIEPVQ